MEIFELKLADKKVPLLWGTYAMKLFTEKKGWTLTELFNFLAKGAFSLSDIIDMIWAAAQYGCRKQQLDTLFGEMEVSEWIDECGGTGAKNSQIRDFLKHVIDSTVLKTSEPATETEEKKS